MYLLLNRKTCVNFANNLGWSKIKILDTSNFFSENVNTRLWQASQTYFRTHGNQLASLSGVHGFKDSLCSAHLVGAFDGQIYCLKHFHKSKFVHQRLQQDEHYIENP